MEDQVNKSILLMVMLLSLTLLFGEVWSHPNGGPWSDPLSWELGVVPNAGDDVAIQSEIMVDDNVNCHNLRVTPTGILENLNTMNGQVTISGDLNNAGIIRNHPWGGSLYFFLSGDLASVGSFTAYRIAFSGSEGQQISSSGYFAPMTLVDTNSASSLTLTTDLEIHNSQLQLGNSHLLLNSAFGSYTLTLNGGYMENAVIQGGNGAVLNLAGAFLSSVSGDEIIVNGEAQIMGTVSFGTLINNGVISNHPSNNYSLAVSQDLYNHGSISNNGYGGTLTLELAGNLHHYGSMTNYFLFFTNSELRDLWQAATANPINCTQVESAPGSVGHRLRSDLRFLNSQLSLGYTTLRLYDPDGSHGLFLDGGWLEFADLEGDAACFLNFTNNAWIWLVSMDSIVWQGTVLVQAGVEVGNLENQGTILNHSSSNYELLITQNLVNHGEIADNAYGGNLFLRLAGNLYDHGSVSNYATTLINTELKDLWQASTADPITCTLWEAQSGSAGHQLLSDLRFSDCQLSLNNSVLKLFDPVGSHGLYLTGGWLEYAVLEGGEAGILSLSNNAWLGNTEFDRVIWQGTVVVASNVSVGTLVNQGMILNHNSDNYVLLVEERLENHGEIFNNPYGGYLYLDLAGDLYLYGTIQNYSFMLVNSSVAFIYQADTAAPIGCQHFQSQPAAADHQLLSGLRFSNCAVDLANTTLRLYNGRNSFGLNLMGGQFINAVLDTDGFGSLDLGGNAYLMNVQGEDLILNGIVLITSNCAFDDLVNYGTLQNFNDANYPLTVGGDFTNFGLLENNPYGGLLFLHCQGDLTNYGSIVCYSVYIDGAQDQYILNTGSIALHNFTLVSDVGPAAWFFNGVFDVLYYGEEININPFDPGVWQPFNAGVWGRYITIGGGALELAAPVNISAFVANGELKLRWDQVADAIYYNLYSTDAPDGPFGDSSLRVFDPDLGDGFVQIVLNGSEARKFYRVTAGN